MKPKFANRMLSLCAPFVLFGLADPSFAVDLYWDANGETTTVTGGTGIWNTANTWRDGSATGTLGNWADGNAAVFGGTAGTVTLSASVSASQLKFTATGYTIGATADTTNAISLSGSYAVDNLAIDASTVVNLTLNAKVTGTLAGGLFLKSNGNVTNATTGRLALANAANDFTGDIHVLQGNLAIAGTNTVYGNPANQIVLNGGGLAVSAAAVSSANNITLSRALAIGANGGNVATNATSGSMVLDFTGTVTGAGTFNRYNGTGAGVVLLTLSGDMAGFAGTFDNQSGPTTVQTSTATAGKWRVTGGILTFPTPATLYDGNPALWTKENLTVGSGATLTLDTAAFTETQVATLFSNLATDINDNGLKANSNVGLIVAPGSTISPVVTDSTGTGGGAVGLRFTGGGNLALDNAHFSGTFTALGGITTITGAATVIGGGPKASLTWDANAAVRQQAGTVTLFDPVGASVANSTNTFIIGGSGYTAYELAGGKFAAINPWRLNPRNAMITQTGGEMEITFDGGGGAIIDGRPFYIGTGAIRGVVYATGGTAIFTTSNVTNARAALTVGDTTNAAGSELTLAGTADWSLSGPAGYVTVTRASNRVGHLNLNGTARLTANQVINGGGGQGRLNFDGGTLRAARSDTGFLSGLTSLRIYAGGAKIDTNGFDVTAGQTLTHPSGDMVTSIPLATGGSGYFGAPIVSISGGGGTGATAVAAYDPATGAVTGITLTCPGSDYTSAPTVTLAGGGGSGATLGAATLGAAPVTGSLTKRGAGTLTLSGSSSGFTGATIVEQGTLNLAGTLSASPITVKSGASVQAGAFQTVDSLTLENGARLVAPLSAGFDYLIATNGINLPGGTAFIIPAVEGMPVIGDYIIAEGALSGPGTIVANFNSNGPSRVGSTTSVVAGKLQVSVTSVGADLVWNNQTGAGTGIWNTNDDTNFLNGAVDDVFLTYDRVTFGNTSPAGTITLEGQLFPAAVEVNSTNDFVFAGTGSIAGTTALTKNGSGTLTIQNTNTFTGPVTVSVGTLVVSGTLGGGAVQIAPGATLRGTGSLAGTVFIDELDDVAAIVAPGAAAGTIGTLATGPLTMWGDYHFDIDGANADLLAVTGALALDNAALAVNFVSPSTAANHPLITYTGTRSGTFAPESIPAGWEIDYSQPGKVVLWPASTPPTDGTITFETIQSYPDVTDPVADKTVAGANTDPNGAAFSGVNGWSLSIGGEAGAVHAVTSSGEYRGGQAVGSVGGSTFTSGRKGGIQDTGANTITFDALFVVGGTQVGLYEDLDHDGLFEVGETGMSFGMGGTPHNFFYRDAGFGASIGAPVTGIVNHWYRYTITIGASIGGNRAITMALRNLTNGSDLDFNPATPAIDPWTFSVTDAQFGTAPERSDGIFLRTTSPARIDNLRATSVARPSAGSYAGWADINGVTGGMDADDDTDGVANGIEFFMGDPSHGFTALPAPDATGKVTWTKGGDYHGAYGEAADYVVQTSSDLATWTAVAETEIGFNGNDVSYTLPPGAPKLFARLKVMGPD